MNTTFHPHRINLSSRGIAKVLGDCEAAILEVLWRTSKLSVHEVRAALLKRNRNISFNATMTILNRLVQKGVLQKHKQKERKEHKTVYVYSAVEDKPKFVQWISREVFQRFLGDPELFSAAGFADAVASLPKKDRDALVQSLNKRA